MPIRQTIKINPGEIPIAEINLPEELDVFYHEEKEQPVGKAYNVRWNGQVVSAEIEMFSSDGIIKVQKRYGELTKSPADENGWGEITGICLHLKK